MRGQLLVLGAGGLSIAVLTVLVAPAIFHRHLLETDLPLDGPDLVHIEWAHRDALLIALGVGLVVSLLAAAAVSWSLSRRLRRTLAALSGGIEALSRGRYTARVPVLGAGAELDALSHTLNEMAARLDAVEETRQRLLADLAHELRTPIATLAAHHEAMADGVLSPEEAADVLAAQTGRLSRLAEDLGEVSRAEEGRVRLAPREVDVHALLAGVEEKWRERCTASDIALRVEGPAAGRWEVTADLDRLAQILDNLLGNALRHTPRGGTVQLTATDAGDRLLLAVADDGEGFSAQEGAHLFERFYRADAARSREGSGSGIGLTISRALAEAHGGELDAASDGPGRGATFTLCLPRGAASR
ncbi:sensor histidine kinase [Brachybacterium saurashtrense]|uniref:histidine kinase n=2 Tax=Brachybacterium saurashtrense TaxID=556288 RepID=A0A345YT95_9MICO|nr:sensor histidine kinase [Brachybacterium saurashtrense]RRR23469.1 sensor histidine kinase [Brachybacterium saurashtrense]